MKQKQVELLFKEIDSDGSDDISLLEFCKALKRNPEVFESPNILTKIPLIPGFKGASEAKVSSLSPIEFFRAIDTDGNGQLSVAELTAALKVNRLSGDAIRAIFKACDKDNSGSISLMEWIKMTKEREELLPTKLEKPPAFVSDVSPLDLFTMMDADGNGSISRSEFQRALSSCSMPASSIEKLFSEADSDNSGSISMLEWMRAVRKFPELTNPRLGKPAPAFEEYLSPMDYFTRMDTDASGQVSKAELSAALSRSNLSPKAIQLIFEKVDADSSGEISMMEWAKAVKVCPELIPTKLGAVREPNAGERMVQVLSLGLIRKE